MFTLMDNTNTARVTLSDPRPNNYAAQCVETLSDMRSIAHAIVSFARSRNIHPAEVEYSIQYPEGKA